MPQQDFRDTDSRLIRKGFYARPPHYSELFIFDRYDPEADVWRVRDDIGKNYKMSREEASQLRRRKRKDIPAIAAFLRARAERIEKLWATKGTSKSH